MRLVAILLIVILAVGGGVAGYLYIQENAKLKDAQSEISSLQGNILVLESETRSTIQHGPYSQSFSNLDDNIIGDWEPPDEPIDTFNFAITEKSIGFIQVNIFGISEVGTTFLIQKYYSVEADKAKELDEEAYEQSIAQAKQSTEQTKDFDTSLGDNAIVVTVGTEKQQSGIHFSIIQKNVRFIQVISFDIYGRADFNTVNHYGINEEGIK